MAKSRKRQSRGGQPTGPVLRPLAWSALLGAVVATVLASPVYADPPLPNAIPDTGSRPVPAGPLPLPGTGPTAPPVASSAVTGPLAAQILAKETEVATLAQQLLRLRQDVATAKAAETAAEAAHRAAATARADTERKAEAAAADALKDAAAMPPGAFGSDLHGLGSFSRIQRGEPKGADTDGAVREAAIAQAEEQSARTAYEAARTQSALLQKQFSELQATYKRAEAALTKLKQDNADQLAVIEQQREAAEQRIGADIARHTSIDGKAAHPNAIAALTFALKQRGKPYVWGAEGPDTYDCSGLMWAAYRSVGYRDLPRVANDQYYATRGKTVARSALLPGDLIFFASGPNWQSIHHVGMYVGDGKMVHAPNSNEVVKVSTVWWSRFYAATRVYDAVDAPAPTPTPKPKPTPKPVPTKPGPKPIPTVPTTPPTQPPPSSTPPGTPPATGGDPSGEPPTEDPSDQPPTEDPSDQPPSGDPSGEPSTGTPSDQPATDAGTEATGSAPQGDQASGTPSTAQ